MDEPGDMRADLERLSRKNERLESAIMTIQALIVLVAVLSLMWLAAGHHVWAPMWVAGAGLLAVAQIYAQRTIRFLRCAHRDAHAYIALLHAQIEEILRSWPHDGNGT